MTGPVQNEQLQPTNGIEDAAQHTEVNTVGLPADVKSVKPETQGEIDEELRIAGLKAAGPASLETKLPGQTNESTPSTQSGHFASEKLKFDDTTRWQQVAEENTQKLIREELRDEDKEETQRAA